jgi:hypothetical protein
LSQSAHITSPPRNSVVSHFCSSEWPSPRSSVGGISPHFGLTPPNPETVCLASPTCAFFVGRSTGEVAYLRHGVGLYLDNCSQAPSSLDEGKWLSTSPHHSQEAGSAWLFQVICW